MSGSGRRTGIRKSILPMRRRCAAFRKTRAAGRTQTAMIHASLKSGYLAKCSRAARIFARQIIAVAIARRRVTPRPSTPRPVTSGSDASRGTDLTFSCMSRRRFLMQAIGEAVGSGTAKEWWMINIAMPCRFSPGYPYSGSGSPNPNLTIGSSKTLSKPEAHQGKTYSVIVSSVDVSAQ